MFHMCAVIICLSLAQRYAYGHAYGDEEITVSRGRAMMMSKYAGSDGGGVQKEKWSESSSPVKRGAAKVGIGLKGIWEALPAF